MAQGIGVASENEAFQATLEDGAEASLLAPIPSSVMAPLVVEMRGVDKMLADLVAASSDVTS
jgi:hypothetical protein